MIVRPRASLGRVLDNLGATLARFVAMLQLRVLVPTVVTSAGDGADGDAAR